MNLAPVYLGIGSNLGNRQEWLLSATRQLAEDTRWTPLRHASVYETEAIGPDAGDPFLNTAVSGLWNGTPPELLGACQRIERTAGRERSRHWGPRTLDLDILYWTGRRVSTPALTIPHPHLTQRAFALVPLLELAPELVEPVTGVRYASYLTSERLRQGVRCVAPRSPEGHLVA